MPEPLPPSREPVVVPRGVEVAVAWTWRLAVLAGGVVLLFLLLSRVALVTASLLAALLLTALLHPLSARLQRAGVRRWLAATSVFVGFLTLVGLGLFLLGRVVAAQASELRGSLAGGVDRLQQSIVDSALPVDQQQLDELSDQLVTALESNAQQLAGGVLTAAGTLVDVLSGLLLALFVLLVLLLDGRTVWRWVVHLLPRGARVPADEAGQRAWHSLSSYMLGIILVAFTDASLIALALVLIGVSPVAPLAALTFVGAFVPYVGATVAGLAAVLVALVDQGPGTALLVLGAVLLVQTIDGYVVEPLIIGRAVRLHPLAVVLAIAVGGLLAGVGGAVVAVPLTAGLNAAVLHLAGRGDRPQVTDPSTAPDVVTAVTR